MNTLIKFLLCGSFFLFTGCQANFRLLPKKDLSLMTWNVQNLFDDVKNGQEYPEFTPKRGWSTSSFWKRCQKISQVIRALPYETPDILAFQEIENTNTLRVLRDRFLNDLGYSCIAGAPDESGMVKVTLLSRLPLQNTALIYPFNANLKGKERPILEVFFQIEKKQIVLFINHWKSRQPSEAVTEKQRIIYAKALEAEAERIKKINPQIFIVAVGDFNASIALSRNLQEKCFISGEKDNENSSNSGLKIWKQVDLAINSSSGWYDPGEETLFQSKNKGTYCFRKKWSTLDHILFYGPSIQENPFSIKEYHIITSAPQITVNGEPRSWSFKDHEGISDHLPLYIHFTFN